MSIQMNAKGQPVTRCLGTLTLLLTTVAVGACGGRTDTDARSRNEVELRPLKLDSGVASTGVTSAEPEPGIVDNQPGTPTAGKNGVSATVPPGTTELTPANDTNPPGPNGTTQPGGKPSTNFVGNPDEPIDVQDTDAADPTGDTDWANTDSTDWSGTDTDVAAQDTDLGDTDWTGSDTDLTDVEPLIDPPASAEQFPIPDNCAPDYSSTSNNACELSLNCGGSRYEDWIWTYCNSYNGMWQCECDGAVGGFNFEATGLTSETACSAAASICAGGGLPELDQAPVCEDSSVYSEGDWCQAEQQCTQSGALADGVALSLVNWRYASCDRQADTVWGCYCNGLNTNLSFELTPEADSNTCSNALDVCQGQGIERSGAIECQKASQSASSDWCTADLECTQQAQAGSSTIQLRAMAQAWCSANGDGTWDCSCDGGGNSGVSFALSSQDSWDTCSLASEQCLDSLDLDLIFEAL